MKKLLIVVVIISLLPSLLLSFKGGTSINSESGKDDGFSFLIAGFDDAGANTDALLLLSYSQRSNSVSFLQIPRDTYYNSGKGTNRINGVFASAVSEGLSKNEAMSSLVSAISGALGIKIDGYAGYDREAFKRILSAVGDIEVVLPYDLTYDRPDGERVVILKKGSNILGAEEALSFVRFREGYLMGDLGRVDAQKFFFKALAEKLRDSFGIRMAFRLLGVGSDGIVTDISPREMASLAIKSHSKIKSAKAYFVTLPGQSTDEGALGWYYAVNLDASKRVISALELNKYREFDLEARLLKADSEAFKAIYYKIGHPYRIYDEGSLTEINIKTG